MAQEERKLKLYGAAVAFIGRPNLERQNQRLTKVTFTLIDEANADISDPQIELEFRLPISDEMTIREAEEKAVKEAARHMRGLCEDIINTSASAILRPPA